MTKAQRYRYEMFVRVHEFGTVNRDVIPESSTGGRLFGQVGAAVAAIEDQLTKRDFARVESRRVKASTRAAVTDYMKVIARTARRVTMAEPAPDPFVLPARRTMPALLSKARLFIDEAKPREAKFVNLGMPPTFISEFSALVDQLHEAEELRNTARALREKAQAGIDNALAEGFEAVRNLDVFVPNALRADPVRLGHWHGARHLEGVAAAASAEATTPKLSPEPATDSPAQPPAGETTTVEVPVDVMRRAS